jgi:hypothetical protein
MISTHVRLAAAIALFCLSGVGSAISQGQGDQFPNPLDDKFDAFIRDRRGLCDDPAGVEIKILKSITAKPGYYFSEFKTTLGEAKNYVGLPECRVLSSQFITIKVTEGGKIVPKRVPIQHTVWVHADCGSGLMRTAAHVARNETIWINCEISGTQTKIPGP